MMSKPVRFGFTISVVAMATAIGGCAAPQHSVSSAAAQPSGEAGLAIRALAALSSGDATTAIGFAERAAAKTPDDAAIRMLLGNTYFAAGRFASAESAYKDAMSINPNQPQAILKLALVEIAQGKNAQAIALLDSGRGTLNSADYGLALALAGHSTDAIAVLEPAARADGADARVRQNLALAYAFAGDWVAARTVAAQDVPANQLDQRIHQWMQLANPAKPSDQVAALIGVTPAASDPGQPVQLALVKSDTQVAEATPAAVPPAAEPQPLPQIAEAAPPPMPLPEAAPGDAPVADAPIAPAFTPEAVAPPPPPPRAARVVHAKLPKPMLRRGNSSAVVQIGAYSNAQRVAAAWGAASKRYGALRNYTPMSAKFDSGKGTFYRLSVKGFANAGEANAVCASVRRGGGSCFVRNIAGDAPVQLASR